MPPPATASADHPFAGTTYEDLVASPEHDPGTTPTSNLISFGDDDEGVFISKGLNGGGRGTLAPAPSPGGSQHSQSQSSGSTGSNKRKASDMGSDGDRNNMTKNQRQKHHGNDYTLTQRGDEWYPACKEFHSILAYLPHLWKGAREQLMASKDNPPGIQHLLGYPPRLCNQHRIDTLH